MPVSTGPCVLDTGDVPSCAPILNSNFCRQVMAEATAVRSGHAFLTRCCSLFLDRSAKVRLARTAPETFSAMAHGAIHRDVL